MIIACMTGTALLAGSGIWALLFRRRSRRITEKDLPNISGFHQDGEFSIIHVVNKLSQPACDEMKSAYMNRLEFRWILLGGDGSNLHFDVDGEENPSVKRAALNLMDLQRQIVGYMIEREEKIVEKYGYTLVSTGKKNGKFLGAVFLIPPYRSRRLRSLQFKKSIAPVGPSLPATVSTDVKARCGAFVQRRAIVRKELLGKTPHWYIPAMAVAPSAQGRGVEKRLMKAAITLIRSKTRKGDIPVYLECHTSQVTFYENLGFYRDKSYDILVEDGSLGGGTYAVDNTPCPYNAMVMHIGSGVVGTTA